MDIKEMRQKGTKLLHRIRNEEDMSAALNYLSQFDKNATDKHNQVERSIGFMFDGVIHIGDNVMTSPPHILDGELNPDFKEVADLVHQEGTQIVILTHRVTLSLQEKVLRNWFIKNGVPEDIVQRLIIPKSIPFVTEWVTDKDMVKNVK